MHLNCDHGGRFYARSDSGQKRLQTTAIGYFTMSLLLAGSSQLPRLAGLAPRSQRHRYQVRFRGANSDGQVLVSLGVTSKPRRWYIERPTHERERSWFAYS